MSWRLFEQGKLWRTVAAVGIGKFCGAAPPPSRRQEEERTAWQAKQPLAASSYPSLISNAHCIKALVLQLLSCSTSVTRLEAPPSVSNATLTIDSPNQPQHHRRYDFIIIGHGATGRSALATLQAQCPHATIALIDPLRAPPKYKRHIHYVADTAVSLDPRQRQIGLLNEDQNTLTYKYGVLIATGAHGAPPPPYLMDAAAQASIWELRPTVLWDDKAESRPLVAPVQTRSQMIRAAQEGQNIGIMGSSWEALDLAVATAAVSSRRNRPTLLFGAGGPLSHTVPNYLSSAIAKRLKQKCVRIQDRTVVRYIQHEPEGGLQLYAARTFDFLDSSRTTVDKLVLAPDTRGPRGNAVCPTADIPLHLRGSRDGRFWYQSWSQLSMASQGNPSMIVCYKDDGRIAVNPELCAATGVYAAGSVAKCGNALTGHADVAGEGAHDAVRAGRVAALNMARHYHQDSVLAFTTSDGPLPAVLRDPIPVWRSDVLSYDDGKGRPTSLASVGIQALCVGTCDSERYSTHGVWWTNQAAQQRIMRLLDQDEVLYGDANEMTPQQNKRRRQKLKESAKMVYGFGIVYYLDRTGRIQGIMTWGIPFAQGPNQEINPALLERMQQVILSNGGMNSLESEFDQMRMSMYLVEESRTLLATAFSKNQSAGAHVSHQLDGASVDFPRPLHRYADAKPMGIRSHVVLKRRDGHGQGILGEDVFSRYQHVVEDPSPPKPVEGGVGFASRDGQGLKDAWNWYDYQLYEQRELRWTENEQSARPPKEDALWIRKGDEMRNVSAKETRQAVMDSIAGVQRAR